MLWVSKFSDGCYNRLCHCVDMTALQNLNFWNWFTRCQETAQRGRWKTAVYFCSFLFIFLWEFYLFWGKSKVILFFGFRESYWSNIVEKVDILTFTAVLFWCQSVVTLDPQDPGCRCLFNTSLVPAQQLHSHLLCVCCTGTVFSFVISIWRPPVARASFQKAGTFVKKAYSISVIGICSWPDICRYSFPLPWVMMADFNTTDLQCKLPH